MRDLDAWIGYICSCFRVLNEQLANRANNRPWGEVQEETSAIHKMVNNQGQVTQVLIFTNEKKTAYDLLLLVLKIETIYNIISCGVFLLRNGAFCLENGRK